MRHGRYCVSRVCIMLAGVLVLSSTALSFAGPQNQSSTDAKESRRGLVRCKVFIVLVKIDVTDTNGDEVPDLSKDDFIVSEDRVIQDLVYFRRYEKSEKQNQPRYELAYYPTNYLFDGGLRRIRVSVEAEGKGKLQVHLSPKYYYADKELLE